MAFVRSDIWETGGRASAFAGADRPVFRFRRGSAAAISFLVHILLLWLFATRLAAGLAQEEEKADDVTGLKLIDIQSQAPEATAAAPAPPAQSPAPATPLAPAVDITVANALPPPEWSVSAIAAPAQAAVAEPAGTSGSAGGEGDYDPYAGAAPIRADPRSAGGAVVLDVVALEAIRNTVSRSIRNGHGTALLAVRVSPAGIVLAAVVKEGSASGEAMRVLRDALIGKRLFRPRAGSGESLQILPLIELRR